jgi:hypothetical protein
MQKTCRPGGGRFTQDIRGIPVPKCEEPGPPAAGLVGERVDSRQRTVSILWENTCYRVSWFPLIHDKTVDEWGTPDSRS